MRRRDDGALSLQLSIKEEFKRHCDIPLMRGMLPGALIALSSAVAEEAWTTEGKSASSDHSSPHLGRSRQPIHQASHLIMPFSLQLPHLLGCA